MRRKKRQRVDQSLLTTKEKRSYRKRLTQVRIYHRQKREWEKRVRLGEISPKFTFEMYRRAQAKGKPIESMAEMETDLKSLRASATSNDEIAALKKIERLIQALKNFEEGKKKIIDTISHLEIL